MKISCLVICCCSLTLLLFVSSNLQSNINQSKETSSPEKSSLTADHDLKTDQDEVERFQQLKDWGFEFFETALKYNKGKQLSHPHSKKEVTYSEEVSKSIITSCVGINEDYGLVDDQKFSLISDLMNDVDRIYDGNEIQDLFTFAHMYLATDFAMK